MKKRSDTLIYKKRHYLLPFKPLLDREYKKFGYKKCEVEKEKKAIFHTVFYVRHKECPTNLRFSILFGINFLLSLYRVIVFPCLVVFVPLILIFGSIIDTLFGTNIANTIFLPGLGLIALTGIFTILSIILSNAARKIYRKEGFGEKTDRALNSRGWDLWSSYVDNDERFCPPGYEVADESENLSEENKDEHDYDDDEIVSLTSEKGEEIDFIKIADIYYQNNFYAILQPCELLDGMDEDEALVFQVTNASGDDKKYNIVMEDSIVDAVFEEYNRLLKQK